VMSNDAVAVTATGDNEVSRPLQTWKIGLTRAVGRPLSLQGYDCSRCKKGPVMRDEDGSNARYFGMCLVIALSSWHTVVQYSNNIGRFTLVDSQSVFTAVVRRLTVHTDNKTVLPTRVHNACHFVRLYYIGYSCIAIHG
jgi:hypothetical protein